MKKRHSPEQIVRKLRQADEKARLWCLGPGGRQGAWHKRGDLSPLEKPLRRDESERNQAPQGARKGERPPEEARRRSSPGHPDSKGGEQKKLLSPARRRKATDHVRRELLSVSERRACRVLGQPRSTQRYARQKGKRDHILKERMVALSRENPRYGYRRVWALLRREGWMVNKKRLYRLWREEGLKVPDKQRKRRRLLGDG